MNRADEIFDLVIIGGGINGVGIAADAAGRGLKVFLCEQNDLASATSSNSSKLIHGGLRYLEHYEFSLVKKALTEREVLLRNAPHIIKPLIFRLPHQPHLRPSWLIRAGLFLYDHLAKRVTLPASKGIKFTRDSPLKGNISHGFEYSDGWVDDSRLVVFNALAAKEHGAIIETQTKCISARRLDNHWLVTFLCKESGKTYEIKSRGIVNAAGPWVTSLFDKVLKVKAPQNIRLVKGSHIVVPRLHNQQHAYMLQNEDQRIVFVIPFEDDFSLIGTTDVEFIGDPGNVKISQQEIDYLLDITNNYFKKQICANDIVTTFSGVRPLLDDESSSAQSVTRDYTLELDQVNNTTPLLSIFGGKITTYRKLAEAAVDILAPFYPSIGRKWTATTPLPGGDFSNKETITSKLNQQYPWLPITLLQRYVRCYGTRVEMILYDANDERDLGIDFGNYLFEAEINYLIKYEWAKSVEDIIWRRTKLGLSLSTEQITELQHFLKNHLEQKVA
jgi:glycerol-3-phosphate dehydrogenase